MLIAVGVVLIGAIIGVAVLRERRVIHYEPGTPEATAQAYVQALFDRDFDLAHGYLAPELQDECGPYQIDFDFDEESAVATFGRVRVDGDRAVIEIRLAATDYRPEPLFIHEYETDMRLVLERYDDEWRIVDTDWPLHSCVPR